MPTARWPLGHPAVLMPFCVLSSSSSARSFRRRLCRRLSCLFFFNDTATTEIYTLSLHDALPICTRLNSSHTIICMPSSAWSSDVCRSEEHTSELQSHDNLVCRLLLEKKKTH